MVMKIEKLLLVTLPIQRAWSFSGISQWIDNLHISHLIPWGQITLKQLSYQLIAYKS